MLQGTYEKPDAWSHGYYDDAERLVKQQGVYGLIVKRWDGTMKYSWTYGFEEAPHRFFLNQGWLFYPGAGYYDSTGNIAEAYYDGKFVTYPNWTQIASKESHG